MFEVVEYRRCNGGCGDINCEEEEKLLSFLGEDKNETYN